ncbi:hypothetical protein AYO20_09577 [Fonsecaea nubica]|uniref:Cupin 2 conserved barrel domain-containing protein n=1 Tax=Fonsecaea nubica TaxID=856822 RepID=A0A178CDV6_9EURO|nr:hypothetical protein AYO20_09577 [Fonsecaea nubica]OAL28158.1 hypothetical protein AYO20_09577 [Fonsecaea nubica]
MSHTPLPHPRRIVTGHDEEGKAIFLADSRIPLEVTNLGASLGVLWETKQVPTDNSGRDDPATTRTTDLANKSGVVLRVVDIEPGTTQIGQDALPQDRVARLWDSVRRSSLVVSFTSSNIYCNSFSLHLIPFSFFASSMQPALSRTDQSVLVHSYLDDGARVDMEPGDVCVQRGTIHGWTNAGTKTARMYFA